MPPRRDTSNEEENTVTAAQLLAALQELRAENAEARRLAQEAQEEVRRVTQEAQEEARRATLEAQEEAIRATLEAQEEMRRMASEAQEAQEELRAHVWRLEGETVVDAPRELRPFSEAIEDEPMPGNVMVPKMEAFNGSSDPNSHIRTFRAQMLITGGTDAVRCKMFVGTLSGAALDWLSTLPDRSIASFEDFSKAFVAQFAANKEKDRSVGDLFGVKQRSGESLKEFLTRFTGEVMQVRHPDETMAVEAFVKGLRAGDFGESLIQREARSMAEIRTRAICHIRAEEVMSDKRKSEKRENGPASGSRGPANDYARPRQPWSRRSEGTRSRNEQGRNDPYHPRPKNHEGGNSTPLTMSRRTILKEVNVARLLTFPLPQGGRVMGSERDKWCEFHRVKGHDTERCFSLVRQIERLVKEGRLDKYVGRRVEEGCKARGHHRQDREDPPPSGGGNTSRNQDEHENPVLGDFNTIAGGFAGGGETSASRKRYSRRMLEVGTIESMEVERSNPPIVFTDADYEGVIPHRDDPVVISIVMMSRNVHKVLVDQGSSADVMFWDTFVGLQIPIEMLQPYDGVLVGFTGDQIECRGYIQLRMTFGENEHKKTIIIRYLVVNAPSSYYVLLGRPALNLLRAVVSTTHLKVKYPLKDGSVGTVRVDQEAARKCYEESMRKRRGIPSDTPQVLCVDVDSGGNQALRVDLDPRDEIPHKKKKDRRDRRPQSVEELKEVELSEGRKVKIGTELGRDLNRD